MTTIEFYRFVLDTNEQKVLPAIALKTYKVPYKEIQDHSVSVKDSDCPLERARSIASRFLRDHYGYVVISLSNQDEYDKPVVIRLCNRKRFWQDMIANGVLVAKQRRSQHERRI